MLRHNAIKAWETMQIVSRVELLPAKMVIQTVAMTGEQDLIPMSEEQLKAFLAKAKGDSSLQEKLKAAKSPKEVVGVAKDHGHEFTADKVNQLSEKELEGLAGGWADSLTCQSYCDFC